MTETEAIDNFRNSAGIIQIRTVSASSPINFTNWFFYSCAETRFTSNDYASCTRGP
jgi:hypothetical protein